MKWLSSSAYTSSVISSSTGRRASVSAKWHSSSCSSNDENAGTRYKRRLNFNDFSALSTGNSYLSAARLAAKTGGAV